MNRFIAPLLNILRHLPRAMAILLVLWSPLYAMQSVRSADNVSTIEAPTPKKSGMGFVLLVSLQRG
ncbi:hypothetical protein GA830_11220 [Mesorhizobium sp. NBSH29]|uniref:hypothetical protein n=1 Tax=Mesorhizobium sp. NBSH29 TaxID=2654249 RepID=UPI001896720C|nr:hypothetical protein [Mesorhizobium sp. NBSH29]QPC87245.1 hypothetical protein GA830_11220 [Mesorhizobium sp. NBSH29]